MIDGEEIVGTVYLTGDGKIILQIFVMPEKSCIFDSWFSGKKNFKT